MDESRFVAFEEFTSLWDEWTEAKKAQRRRLRAQERLVTEQWTSAFKELERKQRELVNSGNWVSGPSTLLSIIGKSRQETYHCRVLGWLMDPYGRHGFGPEFLKRFVRACLPNAVFDESDFRRASVSWEVWKPDSRADIVIVMPNGTIIIEAKVNAPEGNRQCDRLHKDWYLEHNPHFVFLTPRGHEPTTATGEARNSFMRFSLRECHDILLAILQDQRTEPADQTAGNSVLNYRETLSQEFMI